MGAMYAPELYTGKFHSVTLSCCCCEITSIVRFCLSDIRFSLFFSAVASFPYPVATPTLAYRGSALRGRGRAVYNTIRSAAATPAAVPAYPG